MPEHTLWFLALTDHAVRDGHAEQTPWLLALREHFVSHFHASPGIVRNSTLTPRARVCERTGLSGLAAPAPTDGLLPHHERVCSLLDRRVREAPAKPLHETMITVTKP